MEFFDFQDDERDYEESQWERRTARRPESTKHFGVNEHSGRAYAAGTTDSHLAWIEVESVTREHRKQLQHSQSSAATVRARLEAGLPPTKQRQRKGCHHVQSGWIEQKAAEDERMAALTC